MVKRLAARTALWAGMVLASGCSLLFRFPDTSGIRYVPARENEVLAEGRYPSIRFDFDVDRESVEALFTVRETSGALSGSYSWAGRQVTFVPGGGFVPGVRYVASFSGTFRGSDGLEYAVQHLLPFYLLTAERSALYVKSSEPSDGQRVSPAAVLRVVFSKDVDPGTLGRGLTLEPDTERSTSWNRGTSELLVSPNERWEDRRLYTMRFGEELRDTAGSRLAAPVEIVFLVQEDIAVPSILEVRPCYDRPAELYPPTGLDLADGVGLRDALRIVFSEAMALQSTAEALRFSPPVAGIRLWLAPDTLLFAPDEGFAPGSGYRLEFGEAAEDLSGNRLPVSETVVFEAVPGVIQVTTELLNDGRIIASGEYGTASAETVTLSPAGAGYAYDFAFTFTGALFDTNAAKSRVEGAVSLLCLFPGSGIPAPVVTGLSWTGDTRLSLTFGGLQPSAGPQQVYYLLRVRGGPGGVSAPDGSRLEADLEQLLLAVE